MNLPFSTFIGPALGLIPDIGPFVSAAYSAEKTAEYHMKVIEDFAQISNELQAIESELGTLAANSNMSTLAAAMNQAPSNVSSWYSNSVESWLKKEALNPSNPPKPISSISKTTCINYLDSMNAAAQGTLVGSSGAKLDWMQIIINLYLAAEADVINTQSISLLEKSYRTFLFIIQIQLKALLCLRASGATKDELAKHAFKLNENIIEQGKHIQANVINKFIENNELAFVWFQINNANASRNLNLRDAVILLKGSQNFGQPISGVQFTTNTEGGNPGTGLKVATADLDRYGRLKNSSWQEMSWDTTIESCGSSNSIVAKASQNLVVEPGQLISGITFHFDTQGGTQNVISMSANVMNVGHGGRLSPASDLNQTMNANTTSSVVNHHLGLDQFTGVPIPCSDSPITGLFFSVTGGNQIVIAMQTSIHKNAFRPYPIGTTPKTGIKSMCQNKYVFANTTNNTIDWGEDPDGRRFTGTNYEAQEFIINNSDNSTISYGDSVTVRHKALYLTEKSVVGAQTVTLEPVGDGNFQWWVLVDPNDTGKTGHEITNWSAVAIKNLVTESYLYSGDSCNVLMFPNKNKTTPTRIDNPNFIWNLALR